MLPQSGEAQGGGAIYVGGGMHRSALAVKLGTTESNFAGWGVVGQAGLEFEFSKDFGLFLEGEYGRLEALNSLQSTTYMEKATNNFLATKAGIKIGVVGFGAGMRQNQIDIDNVSSTSTGYRTSYKGLSKLVFANVSFEAKNNFRTIVEAQYSTGTLEALTVSESQISLRLVFSPF